MSDTQGKKPKAPPAIEKRPVTHSFTPTTAYDVSILSCFNCLCVIYANIGWQVI